MSFVEQESMVNEKSENHKFKPCHPTVRSWASLLAS